MKSIFESKEQYLQHKAAWKKAANTKELSAIHFALHAVIMGKDIFKTFTPVTNPTKLSCSYNGQPYYTAIRVISDLQWIADQAVKGTIARQYDWYIKPHFGEIITPQIMASLAERILNVKNELYAHNPPARVVQPKTVVQIDMASLYEH